MTPNDLLWLRSEEKQKQTVCRNPIQTSLPLKLTRKVLLCHRGVANNFQFESRLFCFKPGFCLCFPVSCTIWRVLIGNWRFQSKSGNSVRAYSNSVPNRRDSQLSPVSIPRFPHPFLSSHPSHICSHLFHLTTLPIHLAPLPTFSRPLILHCTSH